MELRFESNVLEILRDGNVIFWTILKGAIYGKGWTNGLGWGQVGIKVSFLRWIRFAVLDVTLLCSSVSFLFVSELFSDISCSFVTSPVICTDLDVSPGDWQDGAWAPGGSADGAQRAAAVDWIHGDHRVTRQEGGKVGLPVEEKMSVVRRNKDAVLTDCVHMLASLTVHLSPRHWWLFIIFIVLLTLQWDPCQVRLHREGCRRFCASWDETHQSHNLQDDTDPPGKKKKTDALLATVVYKFTCCWMFPDLAVTVFMQELFFPQSQGRKFASTHGSEAS